MRLDKQKKGFGTFAFLTTLILMGLLTILLALFASKTGEETESLLFDWKSICKASVDAHASLHLSGLDFSSGVECPTNNIVIKGDLTKAKAQQDAKRAIANAMADCWNAFGEGRKDLFSGEGIFCSVCHIIEFEEPKAAMLSGFEKYYYTTEAPGKGITYSEYIAGISYGDMFQGEYRYAVEQDALDTTKPYAVVFYYPKGQDYARKFIEVMDVTYPGLIAGGGLAVAGTGIVYAGSALSITGVGAVAGLPMIIIGAGITALSAIIGWFTTDAPDEWAAFTFLRPYSDKILEGCTYLPVEQGEWWKQGEKIEI